MEGWYLALVQQWGISTMNLTGSSRKPCNYNPASPSSRPSTFSPMSTLFFPMPQMHKSLVAARDVGGSSGYTTPLCLLPKGAHQGNCSHWQARKRGTSCSNSSGYEQRDDMNVSQHMCQYNSWTSWINLETISCQSKVSFLTWAYLSAA